MVGAGVHQISRDRRAGRRRREGHILGPRSPGTRLKPCDPCRYGLLNLQTYFTAGVKSPPPPGPSAAGVTALRPPA